MLVFFIDELLKATLVFPYVYTSLNDVLNETDSFIKCRVKIHGNRKFKLNVDSYVLLDISKPVDCHYQYHTSKFYQYLKLCFKAN